MCAALQIQGKEWLCAILNGFFEIMMDIRVVEKHAAVTLSSCMLSHFAMIHLYKSSHFRSSLT
jgi:hypothetical protein